ncbi:hypothetical protein KBD71_01810 [Candidatus Woesebacteria bacterium]|nr:hypothetical protein [Candidatus Woesebacteria bacterium]
MRKDTKRIEERREEVSKKVKIDGYWSRGSRYSVENMQNFLDALLSIEDVGSHLALLAIRGFNLELTETIIAAEQDAVALTAEWNTSSEKRGQLNSALYAIGNELLSLFDIEQRKDKFISSRRN